MRPAALRRGASTKATSRAVGSRAFIVRASVARNPAQRESLRRAKPSRTRARFSPISGATSAMVPMAAMSAVLEGGLEAQVLMQRPQKMKRHPRPGEFGQPLLRKGRERGVDDETVGQRLTGVMVVGDDDLDPRPLNGLDFGEVADAAVDGDEQVGPFGVFAHAQRATPRSHRSGGWA